MMFSTIASAGISSLAINTSLFKFYLV